MAAPEPVPASPVVFVRQGHAIACNPPGRARRIAARVSPATRLFEVNGVPVVAAEAAEVVWNAALVAGFGSFAVSLFVIGSAYVCLIFCVSELSSGLPFAGMPTPSVVPTANLTFLLLLCVCQAVFMASLE